MLLEVIFFFCVSIAKRVTEDHWIGSLESGSRGCGSLESENLVLALLSVWPTGIRPQHQKIAKQRPAA